MHPLGSGFSSSAVGAQHHPVEQLDSSLFGRVQVAHANSLSLESLQNDIQSPSGIDRTNSDTLGRR